MSSIHKSENEVCGKGKNESKGGLHDVRQHSERPDVDIVVDVCFEAEGAFITPSCTKNGIVLLE